MGRAGDVRRTRPGPPVLSRPDPQHALSRPPPSAPAERGNRMPPLIPRSPARASPAAPPVGTCPVGRAIAARILVIVGIVLRSSACSRTTSSARRSTRTTSGNTSEELIANDKIRDQLALTMVDVALRRTSTSPPSSRISCRRTSSASPGRSPASRATLADRAAREVLERPRVQQLFVGRVGGGAAAAGRGARGRHQRCVDTTNGNVVLDIRPLVLELGDRFQFVRTSPDRIPQDSAQVTILQSDDLATAQDLTQWLKAVANWIWILAVALLGARDLARPGPAPPRGAGDRDRARRRRRAPARDPLARRQLHRRQRRRHRVGQARGERGVGDHHRQPRRVGLGRDLGRRARRRSAPG